VSPVRYEHGFYSPEDGILHSHRRENLKSYIALTGWALSQRRNVCPVRYELGFYIPEDGVLNSHRRGNLKSYIPTLRLGKVPTILAASRNVKGPGLLPALPALLRSLAQSSQEKVEWCLC
jgi:hypothetical protein